MKKNYSLWVPFVAMVLFFAFHTSAFAQQSTIKGKVFDENGESLPGASVLVKGTTTGAVTDIDGNFSISVNVTPQTVLRVSFIGYKTQEVALGSQTEINITMESDMDDLSEVVVVGYGEQKKVTLTGSVSQIDGAELTKSPQPNVSNSLAGRFSGLIASNRSGEPGYDGSSISVRGLATTGNNDVLVVIDGVPGQIGGLERLNPDDIESVSVLKDASAAVYGSRAANGVILITTKRGKTGKPVVSYSYNQGFSSPTRLPRLADAATYGTIRNEIAYYNNNQNGLNQVYSPEEIELFRNGSDPLNYPNTNWQRETLQNFALQNQHNLSVRGGSENVNYFVSLGQLTQDGLYKNGVANFNQYSFRSNIDANINERLTVGLGLSGRKEARMFPTEGAGHIFRSIYRAYPTVNAFYPNGLPSTGIENANPAILATDMGGTNDNPRYVFNGILRAKYELPFLEGLSVDGFYSVDESSDRYRTFRVPYTLHNYNRNADTYDPIVIGGGPNQRPSLDEGHENISMIVSHIKLNFNRSFGKHFVDAFVGYEQSENKSHTFGAARINFPTAETPELSQGGSAATDFNNWGESYNFTRRSFISKLNYNYNEKYLLEVQARVDGSSIFPRGNRYGFFPAVSAGYRISEEDWFRDRFNFMDDLKFRVSHGQLGNDNVGQFQFYDNYTFNNRYVLGNVVRPGIDLIRLGNPNITWETANKTDIGLNAVWLKKFTTEFIYFYEDRTNILTTRNASIPWSSGIVNPHGGESLVPSENIGRVKSRGIETTLGYEHRGQDFRFGASGNFTFAKNEVVFMDEAAGVLDYQRLTGRPMNNYLLYRAIGIFTSEDQFDQFPHVPGSQLGDLIYEDINGDGEITADDMYRTELGNIPQITFGLNLNASYKNFDFAMLFSGQGRARQYVLPESGTVGNYYSSWADNRWSPDTPNGTYPRVSERASTAISGGLFPSDFWLQDVSFVRLKNLEVGYTVPKAILERYSIGNLRVYANGFNLLTITKVKDFDPEGSSNSGQFYPQQRIINLGVNIQF
ncbi:TonB-dependent receptor [Belliella sp. DSM 107340]|uniref:TonB-dependent receptor n=1 Tax=Belliella calami TaxID=2923436 RepID=A0ABS9UNY1_9BACT|nr:TonB-dependent receptor [Belliella calami]MCH7398164.1 TonB-dependent receptor [Belliella calami]